MVGLYRGTSFRIWVKPGMQSRTISSKINNRFIYKYNKWWDCIGGHRFGFG